MKLRVVALKRYVAAPVIAGINVAAGDGPAHWPRLVRTTDIAGPRTLGADIARVDPELVGGADVRPGDLLFSRTGSIGTVYLATGEHPAAFAGYLVRVRVDARVADPGFLGYWSESSHAQQQMRAGAIRSTIDNFNATKIGNLHVPSQPLARQQATAAFLDRECDRVARAHAMLSAFATTRAELTQLFVDECASGAPSVQLGWVADIQTGMTLNGQSQADTGVPYLRVANVQHDRIDVSDIKRVAVGAEALRRYALRTGDVLMTEGGDVDKLGRGTVWHGEIEPCLHQNHVFAVRPHMARLLPGFLAAATRSSRVRSYFERTASRITNMASTNVTKLRAMPIPLPAIDEQAARLERLRVHENQLADLDVSSLRRTTSTATTAMTLTWTGVASA